MSILLPTLFTAHGNPMNALGGTPFSTFLSTWAESFPRPRAILCISAHYEREILTVTSIKKPDTIHDFYGFPDALYKIIYPVSGSPEVAAEIHVVLKEAGFQINQEHRGIDHGVWTPLRFIYPDADIPVVQLSLPTRLSLDTYPKIGRALAPLRSQGILIIGSGNLVHNLGQVSFNDRQAPTPIWAEKFDTTVKEWILARDEKSLVSPWISAQEGRISHPSLEHYAPILFVYGASDATEKISFPFEGFEHGSLSMRCVRFG